MPDAVRPLWAARREQTSAEISRVLLGGRLSREVSQHVGLERSVRLGHTVHLHRRTGDESGGQTGESAGGGDVDGADGYDAVGAIDLIHQSRGTGTGAHIHR